MVDVYLVALIAAGVALVALALWFGLKALGVSILEVMMVEFALAVLGSVVTIATFFLAR